MAEVVKDKWWDVGRHSQVLVDIIKEKRPEKMAEIGVFEARSARWILRQCGDIIKEYWGVDKYNTTWIAKGKTFTHPKQTEEKWHEMYKRACRYMPFFPQFRMLRMDSKEAADLFPKRFFPEGYFDFVYIDADHTYEMVKRDIEIWLPLIKKGGMIGGHDYGFPDEVVRWGGVQKAVDEKFGVDNIKVYKRQGVWLVEC